jgi:uncharacterized coiled-coil protein SlyX
MAEQSDPIQFLVSQFAKFQRSLEDMKNNMEGLTSQVQQLQERSNSREINQNQGNRRRPPPNSSHHPYEEEEVNTPDLERDIRMEVREFNGKGGPDVFLDWLRELEKMIDHRGYNDHQSYKLASLKLTKLASLWFENLQRTRVNEGKGKIRSWEKLRKRLCRKYVPPSYKQDKFMKLQALKQGGRSVAEYIEEFEELHLVCDLNESDEQKRARFVYGLDYYYQKSINMMGHIPTYDGVSIAAQNL